MTKIKYLLPVIYLTVWAHIHIPYNEEISSFINSYSGYHALALHFTIYLAFELLVQYKPYQSDFLYILIRKSRLKYISQHILHILFKSLLFIAYYYFIFLVIFMMRYNNNQMIILFILYIPVMTMIYFIFSLLQNMIYFITNHSLLSLFITLLFSVLFYYTNSYLLSYIEFFEQFYSNSFDIQHYLFIVWILIAICLFLIFFYMFIFLKKDLMHYEE